MQPPLPALTPAERMIASRLLGLLEPHFDPSVWMLYQKTFGGRAGNPSDGLPEEHLKYRKLFSLQFDDEYVVAKRRIVERASGRGISLASYPRFFLEDFANFSTVIARHWKRRWGPVGDAMRVFNMLMLADMAVSLSYFDETVERDMSAASCCARRGAGGRSRRSGARKRRARARGLRALQGAGGGDRRLPGRTGPCPGRTLPSRRRSTGLRSRRAGQAAATAAHPVHVRYRRFAGPRPAEIRLRLR